MSEKYPASYLWTNAAELLHELDIRAGVNDVKSFGYLPDEGPNGAVFVEVFTHDQAGAKTGTVRHTRWITFDMKFADWGNPPV